MLKIGVFNISDFPMSKLYTDMHKYKFKFQIAIDDSDYISNQELDKKLQAVNDTLPSNCPYKVINLIMPKNQQILTMQSIRAITIQELFDHVAEDFDSADLLFDFPIEVIDIEDEDY